MIILAVILGAVIADVLVLLFFRALSRHNERL